VCIFVLQDLKREVDILKKSMVAQGGAVGGEGGLAVAGGGGIEADDASKQLLAQLQDSQSELRSMLVCVLLLSCGCG